MAAGVQEDLEEPSNVKVRKGGSEEIPLIQGKGFAGATMKRYSTPNIRETQVRW